MLTISTSTPTQTTITIHPKYDGLTYVQTPSGDTVLILHRWIENNTVYYRIRHEDEIDAANDVEAIAVESELSPLPEIECSSCDFTHTYDPEFSDETGNCWECTFKALGFPLDLWHISTHNDPYGWNAVMRFDQKDDGYIIHTIYERGSGSTQRTAILNAYHFAYETLIEDLDKGVL